MEVKISKAKVLRKEETNVSIRMLTKKTETEFSFSSKIQGDVSELHSKIATSVNAGVSVVVNSL